LIENLSTPPSGESPQIREIALTLGLRAAGVERKMPEDSSDIATTDRTRQRKRCSHSKRHERLLEFGGRARAAFFQLFLQ
jgi:hypothetical protein